MHVYSTYMYNLSPVNAILGDLCEMEVGGIFAMEIIKYYKQAFLVFPQSWLLTFTSMPLTDINGTGQSASE